MVILAGRGARMKSMNRSDQHPLVPVFQKGKLAFIGALPKGEKVDRLIACQAFDFAIGEMVGDFTEAIIKRAIEMVKERSRND